MCALFCISALHIVGWWYEAYLCSVFRLIKDFNSGEPFDYNRRIWEDSGECAALFAMMDVFDMDDIRMWVMCGLGKVHDDMFMSATAIGALPTAIRQQHGGLITRCIKSIAGASNTQSPSVEGKLYDFMAKMLLDATWIELGIKYHIEQELDFHEDLLAEQGDVGDI